MITAAPRQNTHPAGLATPMLSAIFRHAARGSQAGILTDIYQEEVNIAIWQRELPATLQASAQALLASQPHFEATMIVTPQDVLTKLCALPGMREQMVLGADIAELVIRFCHLFRLSQVDLSLMALNQTMCPKFHTDSVFCRLLTTYQGVATEWLPHHRVDRTKLGAGSNGLADEESGLFQSAADIQQPHCGDVALLKGDLWEGNENAGLVHRSPSLGIGEQRLLLKLDFTEQHSVMM